MVAPCFLNKICVPFLMLAPSRHAGGTFSGSKASRNFLSCADEAPIFASRRRRIWRYSDLTVRSGRFRAVRTTKDTSESRLRARAAVAASEEAAAASGRSARTEASSSK